MTKTMVLKAATNNVGSECECDMGFSPEEWATMSEEEQQQNIREYTPNILEIWVEESET